MSKPQKIQKPSRQEYLAKVRYINNLPPPPLNPKFIKYDTTTKTSAVEESNQIMSSLFRKENFMNLIENVDEENGMNVNLINNSGVLDNGDDSILYKGPSVELHPKDRALLRDAGIGKISRKEPEVSFLRRTEYIAERSMGSSGKLSDPTKIGDAKDDDSQKLDAESQLKAIENTFEATQKSLNNLDDLKHPTKKKLKAVNTWPLLPDTSMMDSKFLTVKFIGSASINRELEALKRQQGSGYQEDIHENNLRTSVFKPITSADGEWMSMYQNSEPENATALYEKINSTEKERPMNLLDEEDEFDQFNLKFGKNYDMNFQKYSQENTELAIKFVNDGKKRKLAYYNPISGKIDLRKYRASTNTQINKFVQENTYDLINLKLREPNTNEMRKMDNLRSEFDPMEYEGEEEEEEEDVEEGKGEEEEQNEEQEEKHEPQDQESKENDHSEDVKHENNGDVADDFDREVNE